MLSCFSYFRPQPISHFPRKAFLPIIFSSLPSPIPLSWIGSTYSTDIIVFLSGLLFPPLLPTSTSPPRGADCSALLVPGSQCLCRVCVQKHCWLDDEKEWEGCTGCFHSSWTRNWELHWHGAGEFAPHLESLSPKSWEHISCSSPISAQTFITSGINLLVLPCYITGGHFLL